jgi:autotransporter-associated beta strand protein
MQTSQAGSATWDLNPGSGDWNTATNWTPATVPNGSADTATFARSNTTNASGGVTVNGITFTPAASAYTITASLTLSGAGITNNSEITQNFVANGGINFMNNASAGASTTFTNPSRIDFFDSSSAGSATFINNGGSDNGATVFFGSATAANGTFINNGGTFSGAFGGASVIASSPGAASAVITNNGATAADATGGLTSIVSTAASAVITNNGATASGAAAGFTEFEARSRAGSATLIAEGGTNGGEGGAIFFKGLVLTNQDKSRVEVFGNGNLDISFVRTGVAVPTVMVGSIEGDGDIFWGAKSLTVGSNNMDTTFSGVIQDGGQNGGTGGSLTKIGTGTLDLTGANTYTGNTNINGGVLKVNGSITSNTRVGHSGTLSGNGTINGNVINNRSVSPGDALGTLTINGNYTNNGGLLIDIAGANSGQFSLLDVLGSADLHGFLDPVLLDGFTPTIGQSFTFLDYASVTGAFSGIHDAVFNDGMERWVVTYQATDAVLTATKNVPDHSSRLLLLTLSLVGLVGLQANLRHS